VIYYEGERISFRPIELEDEPKLHRWINDPENWRTLAHRGPMSSLAEREWIQSLVKIREEYVFGIVVKDPQELIGTVGLREIDPISRKASFGICIGDAENRGRGYGTEATKLAVRFGFEELNLNRIELSVFAHNVPAIFAYQKAGFVHEGTFRQAVWRNGAFHDEYRFAILKSEWEAE
jgi:RimJ/RimL family protein N-acetyltransferase